MKVNTNMVNYNPSDDMSDEDETGVVSPSAPAVPAPLQSPSDILAKLQSLKSNPTQNPPPVGDTLSRLLGQSRDEMSNAQQQRNSLQLMSMLGQAGSTVGQALTPLAPKVDHSAFWSALNQQSQQPIQDVLTDQATQKGALQEQVEKGKAATEMEKTDPNSAISQAARDFYAKTTGKEADPSLDAAALERLDPVIGRMFSQQENAKNRSAMANSSKEAKVEADQAKAYSDARQKVASFRGNAGAQQASRDVLSVDKALLLVDKPGMKTTQDLQLLADEMAKIATGGVPGEHGVKALMPNNLQTKYAEMVNFLSSKPTDAQATEYLERNKQYLKDMNMVAKKTLYDYSKGLAKGYKKRLAADDFKELNDDIESQYGEQSRAPASHPQDDEAMKWAKSNPDDPRSAAILKANGAQ